MSSRCHQVSLLVGAHQHGGGITDHTLLRTVFADLENFVLCDLGLRQTEVVVELQEVLACLGDGLWQIFLFELVDSLFVKETTFALFLFTEFSLHLAEKRVGLGC